MDTHRQQNMIDSPGERSRGVALLLVLGMLAMLLMLGVAFGVSMRVERLTSSHYRTDVKTRQFAHVGLTRALEFIESDVGSSITPSWQAESSSGGSSSVDGLLGGDLPNWIPRKVYSDALAAAGAARWQTISADGEFTYVVMNIGDTLDVGSIYAAGGQQHIYGTNVAEIALSGFPMMRNESQFLSTRATLVP